jgi:tetratricopeptide (TPR) repeat protein
MIFYYSRRYDECIAQCRKTLELDRYFETAYGWLARSYELQGRQREAVEAYVEPLLFEEATRKRGEALRAAGLEGGLRAFWREWLRHERLPDDVNTDTPALAWLGVGDRERALGELERLCDQRSPWMRALNVEPAWDPIRESPRFQALLRRVNLVRSPS